MTNEERKDAERVQLEQAVHAEDAAGRRYILVDSRVLAQLREQAAGGWDDRVLRAAGVSREQADAAARAVDLDALPKALSADERSTLRFPAACPDEVRLACGRALALIDALTALVAEQAAQIVLDGQRIAELERSNGAYETAERRMLSELGDFADRVRELEDKQLALEAIRDERPTLVQKLADANALLEYVLKCSDPDEEIPFEAIQDHLAGQPAAPSRPPLPPRSIVGRPELTEEFPNDAAPSRTEAEHVAGCRYEQEFPAIDQEDCPRCSRVRTESEQCTERESGGVRCELPAGHHGNHACPAFLTELALRGLK